MCILTGTFNALTHWNESGNHLRPQWESLHMEEGGFVLCYSID